MTRDPWALVDRRPKTTPVPWKAGRNPWLPDRPFSFPNPGTLPTSQAPSQPPRAEGEASTRSWAQASRATRGEGEKLPNGRRRGLRRRGRREALGYRQASHPFRGAASASPRSPEALRQTRRRLRTTRWSVTTGVGVGRRCRNWPQRRRSMEVLGPTEPSDLTSKDVTGRLDGRDTPETTSRNAGRASPGTARRGSRCPGSRRTKETGGGEARSCLPTRLLHYTPSHCRPFQKATNPTAGSPGAGSPQARGPPTDASFPPSRHAWGQASTSRRGPLCLYLGGRRAWRPCEDIPISANLAGAGVGGGMHVEEGGGGLGSASHTQIGLAAGGGPGPQVQQKYE